jgi:hypothetical protein
MVTSRAFGLSRLRCFNMTPTRTDTTLQQKRRAFNNISLSSTHTNMHSIDATRSKGGRAACSTAASRVNNEQGSNNTCRYHREQLLNWLMSKDAIASCFIKDVHAMSENKHAGGMHLPASVVSILSQLSKRQVFPITFSVVYPADQSHWLPL